MISAGGLHGADAVGKVLDAVDAACAAAGEMDEREVFDLVDEIDDIDLQYRGKMEDNFRVASSEINAAKFAAFGVIQYSDNVAKNAWDAYRNASSAGCFGSEDDPDVAITNSEFTYEQMRADFENIKRLATENRWNDESPMTQDVFGPMWPTTTPTWATGQSSWDDIK